MVVLYVYWCNKVLFSLSRKWLCNLQDIKGNWLKFNMISLCFTWVSRMIFLFFHSSFVSMHCWLIYINLCFALPEVCTSPWCIRMSFSQPSWCDARRVPWISFCIVDYWSLLLTMIIHHSVLKFTFSELVVDKYVLLS